MSAEWAFAAAASRESLVSAPQPALARSALTRRSTSAAGPAATAGGVVVRPFVGVALRVAASVAASVEADGDAGAADEGDEDGAAPAASAGPSGAAAGGS